MSVDCMADFPLKMTVGATVGFDAVSRVSESIHL